MWEAALEVAPDESAVYTVSPHVAGLARKWSTRSSSELNELADVSAGPLFSLDGSMFQVARFSERTVEVRSSDSLEVLASFESAGRILGFLPGDKEVAAVTRSPAGDEDWTIGVWDITEGRSSRTTPLEVAPDEMWTCSPVVSPNWKQLVRGNAQGEIVIWDFLTGDEVRRLKAYESEAVGGVYFSNDGQLLVTKTTSIGKSGLTVWNAGSWNILARLEYDANVTGVCFSPDDRMLVVTGWGWPHGRMWDTRSFEQLEVPELREVMDAVAFSPDGRTMLVQQSARPTLISSRNYRTMFVGAYQGYCGQAAFSPDGRIFATRNHRRVVSFWRAPTFGEIALGGYRPAR